MTRLERRVGWIIITAVLGLVSQTALAAGPYVAGSDPGNKKPGTGAPWQSIPVTWNANAGDTIWIGMLNVENPDNMKVWKITYTAANGGDLELEDADIHPGTGQKAVAWNKNPKKTGPNQYQWTVSMWPQPQWEVAKFKAKAGGTFEFNANTLKCTTSCEKLDVMGFHASCTDASYIASSANPEVRDLAIYPRAVSVDPNVPPAYSFPPGSGPWSHQLVYNLPNGQPKPQGGWLFRSDGPGIGEMEEYSLEFMMMQPADVSYALYMSFDDGMTWEQFPLPDAVPVYDNGEFVTEEGNGYNYADTSALEGGCTQFGFNWNNADDQRVADDFEVPPEHAWTLTSARLYGYQDYSGEGSTFTGAFVTIYDGRPDAGGYPIFGDYFTNRLKGTGWTNCYRVTSSAPQDYQRPVMYIDVDLTGLPVLPAGQYWIGVAATGWLPAGPFIVPVAPHRETDNAIGYSGGYWEPLDGNPGMPGTQVQDIAFELIGTALGPEPCDPCDANCDGSINGGDIGWFIDLLNGVGTPCSPCAGDTNADGSINGSDIENFIRCLNA